MSSPPEEVSLAPYLDLDWEDDEKLIMDAMQEFDPSLDLFKDWMGWMLHRRLELIMNNGLGWLWAKVCF